MPQNVADTFVILKPEEEWRSEAELDELIAVKMEEMERIVGHGEEKGAHGDEGGGHGHDEVQAVGHKGKLLKLIELSVKALPGNNYEFTQPIEMRFNELIAGVRGDVAVKVYGDDFDSMRKTADQILAVLQT
ncbi:MAG: efflux RND transporter permease subunit, partial [Caldilineaceae bacterium]|nr:efflux RND transporter permease subunit [Caldilineaceae bacterium]